MLKKIIWCTAASLLFLAPTGALASPKPVIEELLKANKTLGGQTVIYPEGTPEMRVYRITLAPGAKIPLHTHPSPVIVYLQKGTLTNVRIVDGEEIIDTIEAESGFLEGSPNEPHYVINNGKIPAVSIVTFASVEGMPNLIKVK
jgi:quercetin dioxygenase-like cupin family protein